MTQVHLIGPENWQSWRRVRLRALQQEPTTFGSTYEREAGFTESDFRVRLAGSGVAMLALAGNEPVGMGAGLRDVEGWLLVVSMWVDPGWRGHGVGRRVLDELITWAGHRDLRVHLDVTLDNAPARAFYERRGFVGTGRTEPLRQGSPELLERLVLPAP